jgi:hypothetical protein
LLRELARLLALGGAWRFLRGPIVAASQRDYPDAWNETRPALAKVIGRTLWHAHLDAEAILEDARAPGAPDRSYLRHTKLELLRADDARIELIFTAIGNDDVAGVVAHEIGRAYVTRLALAGHPFRAASDGLADAASGSLATIALGLGVVAANAAHHDRSAGETIGRTSYHAHEIAHAGGADWQDLTFLLAVQATVRDDVLTALDTLRPSQAEDVASWREVLDDHERELVDLLALDDVDREARPTRAATPREVTLRATFEESDLARANLGRAVFRYPAGSQLALGGILGLFAGVGAGGAVSVVLGPGMYALGLVGVGTIAGAWRGRRKRLYRCATCRSFITVTAIHCERCGGRIMGDIDHPDDRLAAEEELEEAQGAEPR